MKIPNISGLVKIGKTFIAANRPEILFGASVATTIGAVVMAAKGGYEARGKVEKEEAALGRELDVKEKIQLTWLCYMPAAITTIGAISSTTSLHVVHIKEKKALATAAIAAIDEMKVQTQQYIQDFSDTVQENTTPEQQEEIQKSLDKKGVLFYGDGVPEELYRVKDEYTGRVFWSTKEKIDSAVNEVNKALNKNGDCDLNTFYMWAGVEELDRGIEVGWSGELIRVNWEDDHLPNGQPVRTFIFHPQPRKGYDDKNA